MEKGLLAPPLPPDIYFPPAVSFISFELLQRYAMCIILRPPSAIHWVFQRQGCIRGRGQLTALTGSDVPLSYACLQCQWGRLQAPFRWTTQHRTQISDSRKMHRQNPQKLHVANCETGWKQRLRVGWTRWRGGGELFPREACVALLHDRASQLLFARDPWLMTVVHAFTRGKQFSIKAGMLPRSATSAHVSLSPLRDRCYGRCPFEG